MNNRNFIIIVSIILFSLMSVGCIGSDSNAEGDVEQKVRDFLNAANEGDFQKAFMMAGGRDFSPEASIGTTRLLAPASIEVEMRNNGFVRGGIDNVEIIEVEVEETIAVATAQCTLLQFNAVGRQTGEIEKEIYFKLQRYGSGWIITRVSFDGPMFITQEEIDAVVIERTPIDTIAENAAVIFGLSVTMFVAGVYLNRKEKGSRSKQPSFNTANATPVQKEAVKKFIRIIPSKNNNVGKESSIDVWIKNFSNQPYSNVMIAAKISPTIAIMNPVLNFGTIQPGETVKRSWKIKPKVSGWNSIEETRVVFEYTGSKYISVIDDPVWVQTS
ncbi:conserved hypothetical protein [Methanosalsum zhilinae DSM 4017]|uniref:Uncharacterized protein n=1 Tax=Methanosalsum zhilinae (strain DSM 4017 / NBRC 107636 / OCM 62 / WeN5) TaxID=679901 RepID=F7XLF5_METZD|nr:hypothetical protein [Methanosalsum zhilinae]AEH60429.1 conserved hypothetical protein [Methanosalsum zhilinae DSM 4017]